MFCITNDSAKVYSFIKELEFERQMVSYNKLFEDTNLKRL